MRPPEPRVITHRRHRSQCAPASHRRSGDTIRNSACQRELAPSHVWCPRNYGREAAGRCQLLSLFAETFFVGAAFLITFFAATFFCGFCSCCAVWCTSSHAPAARAPRSPAATIAVQRSFFIEDLLRPEGRRRKRLIQPSVRDQCRTCFSHEARCTAGV